MVVADTITPIHAAVSSGSRRAQGRARLGIAARLVSFSGTSSCVLMDLSYTGACIRTEVNMRVGAMIVVESQPMELFGTVRWARGGFAGFEFDKPLSLEQAIAFRRHADAEAGREERERMAYARKWATGA